MVKVSFKWLVIMGCCLSLAGCLDSYSENANSHCDQLFPEAKLASACKFGVNAGAETFIKRVSESTGSSDEKALVQVLSNEGLQHFRARYLEARGACLQPSTPSEQMACLDGVDGFAAKLGLQMQFELTESEPLKLDDDYYQTHNYFDLYDDFDDRKWFYILLDQFSNPDSYPGRRRDKVYIATPGIASGPPPGNTAYGNWYSTWQSANHTSFIYVPVSSTGYSSAGGRPARSYGPASEPGPNEARTDWYHQYSSEGQQHARGPSPSEGHEGSEGEVSRGGFGSEGEGHAGTSSSSSGEGGEGSGGHGSSGEGGGGGGHGGGGGEGGGGGGHGGGGGGE